jgi:hypothetical protein
MQLTKARLRYKVFVGVNELLTFTAPAIPALMEIPITETLFGSLRSTG